MALIKENEFPENRRRMMGQKRGDKSSERPVIDVQKRELVKKAAYMPPAITTVFFVSNFMAPRGSPPDPPFQPQDSKLLRLLNRLRLKR
jgi:hypothetical protein